MVTDEHTAEVAALVARGEYARALEVHEEWARNNPPTFDSLYLGEHLVMLARAKEVFGGHR